MGCLAYLGWIAFVVVAALLFFNCRNNKEQSSPQQAVGQETPTAQSTPTTEPALAPLPLQNNYRVGGIYTVYGYGDFSICPGDIMKCRFSVNPGDIVQIIGDPEVRGDPGVRGIYVREALCLRCGIYPEGHTGLIADQTPLFKSTLSDLLVRPKPDVTIGEEVLVSYSVWFRYGPDGEIVTDPQGHGIMVYGGALVKIRGEPKLDKGSNPRWWCVAELVSNPYDDRFLGVTEYLPCDNFQDIFASSVSPPGQTTLTFLNSNLTVFHN
jgi:hypothetical protein